MQVGTGYVNSLLDSLNREYGGLGFEFKPFKVGWYNSLVRPIFKLNYDENSVAFLIISIPKMFENAFVPFLKQKDHELSGLNDPIDECMMFYLSKISQLFPDHKIKVVHDFELHPNRRPKLVMQSVAHASGAAYLYHPNSTNNTQKKKMFGVCIHPEYGGWFALRAVAFFEDLQCPDLSQTFPKDVVPSKEDRTKLLELYNFHWEDWRFRDIIPVTEKYSDLQIKYFSTPPGNRECLKAYFIMYCKKTSGTITVQGALSCVTELLNKLSEIMTEIVDFSCDLNQFDILPLPKSLIIIT